MTMVKLRLTGCDRFNFKGELYEKGKVYMVGENKAEIMLRKKDGFDRPYFTPYVAPAKSRESRIAEAAAKAAIAAAKEAVAAEEEIVTRPDGSEPEVAEEEPEVDPDAAVEVEVDTDDDPELDEEDPENPEEVTEDRDDGTAEEV